MKIGWKKRKNNYFSIKSVVLISLLLLGVFVLFVYVPSTHARGPSRNSSSNITTISNPGNNPHHSPGYVFYAETADGTPVDNAKLYVFSGKAHVIGGATEAERQAFIQQERCTDPFERVRVAITGSNKYENNNTNTPKSGEAKLLPCTADEVQAKNLCRDRDCPGAFRCIAHSHKFIVEFPEPSTPLPEGATQKVEMSVTRQGTISFSGYSTNHSKIIFAPAVYEGNEVTITIDPAKLLSEEVNQENYKVANVETDEFVGNNETIVIKAKQIIIQPSPTLKPPSVGNADVPENINVPDSGFSCVSTTQCNLEGSSCTDDATVSDTVAYMTSKLSGVLDLRQTLNLHEQDSDMWLGTCFTVTANGATTYVCTTGDDAQDQAAGLMVTDGSGNTISGWAFMQQQYPGIAIGAWGLVQAADSTLTRAPIDLSQPLNNAVTTEDIEVSVTGVQDIDYTFMVIYPEAVAAATSSTGGGHKQATLSHQTACQLIQDPYGTVFDSYTLEPLDEAQVTLLKNENGKYIQVTNMQAPAVTHNPITTKKNGAYQFLVPDGEYRLDVAREGYTFPSAQTNLNPFYSQLYADIYRGEPILQQGEMEHRDIPLDPVDKSQSLVYAQQNSIEFDTVFQTVDRQTNEYIIQGSVSHPVADIFVYGKEPMPDTATGFEKTRVIGQDVADQDGQFEIIIDLSSMQENELVGEIEAIKRNVLPQLQTHRETDKPSLLSFFQNLLKVQAESRDPNVVSMDLDPILNTVEGYAYDKQGKTLAKAEVQVYIPYSTRPVYTTKTDKNGYYTIPSEELPNIEYDISYVPENGTPVEASTSRFVAQNASYLDSRNIDVYAYNTGTDRTETQGSVAGVADQYALPGPSLRNMAIMIIGGILSLLVVGSASILGYALARKGR